MTYPWKSFLLYLSCSNEQLDIWVWSLGEWSELQAEIPYSWYSYWGQIFFQVSDRHLWFFYFFFKPLNAFIFNFFWTLSFPLYKKVLVVPSPPPSPSARSVPAARALLLPLKSGNKYQKKWHQVFMLSDGTKWASETCQAGRYWVWITSRCRRECGGLLLWSLSLGAGTMLRPPATCPGRCPGLGCLPSGLCACASPPPLDWGGWCC